MKNKHCDLLHSTSNIGGINNIISVAALSDEIGIFHLKATSECMSSWRNSGIALINQIRANKRCWIKRLQDEECSSQHFSWPEWEPFKFSTISLVSLKWHCCSLARMKKNIIISIRPYTLWGSYALPKKHPGVGRVDPVLTVTKWLAINLR